MASNDLVSVQEGENGTREQAFSVLHDVCKNVLKDGGSREEMLNDLA